MRESLALIGSIVVALSFLPYLVQVARREIKPRIASWATWSLITGIATLAAFSDGAYNSALLTGVATVVELSVLVLALRNGDHDYGWVDGASQVISLFSVGAWLYTGNPFWAILFNILADFFAAVPTLYHAWIAPHEEAWQSFAIFAIGAGLTFLSIENFTFVNVAFPVYLFGIASLIASTIFFRQKQIKPVTIKS